MVIKFTAPISKRTYKPLILAEPFPPGQPKRGRTQPYSKVTFLPCPQDSNHEDTMDTTQIRCARRVVVVHFSIVG